MDKIHTRTYFNRQSKGFEVVQDTVSASLTDPKQALKLRGPIRLFAKEGVRLHCFLGSLAHVRKLSIRIFKRNHVLKVVVLVRIEPIVATIGVERSCGP